MEKSRSGSFKYARRNDGFFPRVLILNTKDLLKNIDITKLKRGIEDLKSFLRENGGSMARLGDEYLILTPNSWVKISN